MESSIPVEVVYADALQQCVLLLHVPYGSSVAGVIQDSGILLRYPAINLMVNRVGIYGVQKALTDQVQAGDRIEIYRPLTADPREIRRQRAQQQKSHPNTSSSP